MLGSRTIRDALGRRFKISWIWKREGKFLILSIVAFNDGSTEDVLNVRARAILARMVLMIWLGAIDEGLKPAVKDLVPWGLENVKYLGLAGDNPLAINFNGGDEAKERENKKGLE